MDVISFTERLTAESFLDAEKQKLCLNNEKVLAESCLGLCVK